MPYSNWTSLTTRVKSKISVS